MVDLDTDGGRLRALRKARGLSMDELAQKVGVHFTTIAKYERSQRPLPDALVHELATALDAKPESIRPTIAPRLPVKRVPLVGRIAAGNWREAIQEPMGWVPRLDGGDSTFALMPDGDSMNLIVPEGSYVFVDPDDFELRDGKVYAVMNGEGETTFKRFRVDPTRLEPCSDNPVHKPIALGREPFTVVGRVVAHGGAL